MFNWRCKTLTTVASYFRAKLRAMTKPQRILQKTVHVFIKSLPNSWMTMMQKTSMQV